MKRSYEECLSDLSIRRGRKGITPIGKPVPAPKDHRVLNIAWGDYTIIKRYSKCQPYVVCWKYDHTDRTWCQGHYFDSLLDAVKWLYCQKHELDFNTFVMTRDGFRDALN